jgi:transposase
VNVLKPHQKTTIATLLERGLGQREIERITGISRRTVRSYQQKQLSELSNCSTPSTGSEQIAPPRPPDPKWSPSDCEPYRTFIEAQVRLRRNATAIYQDLVDHYQFSSGYSSVKRFVRGLKHTEPAQFDRLEFGPAEEVQVDYGEGAMTLYPGTDRYRKPRLFVMTLRYSRRSFRRVVWKSSQEAWAQLHEQGWRYFGGSTDYVVLDNLREGVIKPDLYEPELNPVYAAVLAHYGVVADPARVRDPNRKGTVESAIQHTQSTALKGRRFASIEEQNAFLEHWETRWAAQRIHGSAKRQVEAMFQEERATLKPLPLESFQYFTEVERTVYDDTCVRHASAARSWSASSHITSRSAISRLRPCSAFTPVPHNQAA